MRGLITRYREQLCQQLNAGAYSWLQRAALSAAECGGLLVSLYREQLGQQLNARAYYSVQGASLSAADCGVYYSLQQEWGGESKKIFVLFLGRREGQCLV